MATASEELVDADELATTESSMNNDITTKECISYFTPTDLMECVATCKPNRCAEVSLKSDVNYIAQHAMLSVLQDNVSDMSYVATDVDELAMKDFCSASLRCTSKTTLNDWEPKCIDNGNDAFSINLEELDSSPIQEACLDACEISENMQYHRRLSLNTQELCSIQMEDEDSPINELPMSDLQSTTILNNDSFVTTKSPVINGPCSSNSVHTTSTVLIGSDSTRKVGTYSEALRKCETTTRVNEDHDRKANSEDIDPDRISQIIVGKYIFKKRYYERTNTTDEDSDRMNEETSIKTPGTRIVTWGCRQVALRDESFLPSSGETAKANRKCCLALVMLLIIIVAFTLIYKYYIEKLGL